jgi:TatD DNase family protein
MLIDTHCHLLDEPLCTDVGGVLSRAAAAGVASMVVPTVSSGEWARLAPLENLAGIHTACGVHPWKAGEGVDEPLLKSFLGNSVAVGEIGLDWKVGVSRACQLDCFETQLGIAVELNLPVLLHCRGAFDELLELIRFKPPPGAVLHGFSRSPDLMRRFLDAGCCIGFGGAITRERAASARACARVVPEDRYVLETDSPWIGVKGGPSEPSSLRLVASSMAFLRGVAPEQVHRVSSENAVKVLALQR